MSIEAFDNLLNRQVLLQSEGSRSYFRSWINRLVDEIAISLVEGVDECNSLITEVMLVPRSE
jgi:hypothetical protein